MKIPPETQTGKIFKLKDLGAGSLRGKVSGDLYVRVVVETPEKLSSNKRNRFKKLFKTVKIIFMSQPHLNLKSIKNLSNEIKSCGAAGKMGKALTSEVQHNKEFEITNYVVKPNSSLLGKDVGSIHFNQQSNSLFVDDPKNAFDMFVDFADAQNISSRIQMYKKHCKPLIFCSTGLSSDEEKSIIALSEKMPVFIAPNTSVVTALMKDFAKKYQK